MAWELLIRQLTDIPRVACLWNGMKEGCLVGCGVINLQENVVQIMSSHPLQQSYQFTLFRVYTA